MKKIYILFLFLSLGFLIRLYLLNDIWFNTDEGDIFIVSKMINKYFIPCDLEQLYCNFHGITYSYITSIFTYFFWTSEFIIRTVNIFLFTIIQLILSIFLYNKVSFTNIIVLNILLLFSSWTYWMTMYARTYTTLTLFFLLFIVYYYTYFIDTIKYDSKIVRRYIILFFLWLLIFLSHPLWYLIFFFIWTSYFLNIKLFKDYKMYILIFLLILFWYFILKYNGYYPLSSDYIQYAPKTEINIWYDNYNNFFKKYFWFFYIIDFQTYYIWILFKYFWFFLFIILFWIIFNKNKNYNKNINNFIIIFLSIFSFFIFYKWNWESVKYMYFLLPIFYILFILIYDNLVFKYKNIFSILLIFFILYLNFNEIYNRVNLTYWSNNNNLFLTRINDVEKYYPDDKTTVEYVNKVFKKWDIIITDYQITQKYLNNKSYGYILPNSPIEILSTHPNTIFYFKDGYYYLYKNWPLLISKLEEINKIINSVKGNVYIITSYDLKNKYFHWWNIDIINFLENNYSKVIYKWKDNQSKVFKF